VFVSINYWSIFTEKQSIKNCGVSVRLRGMVFTPSEECDNNTVRRERRMLFQENNDIEQNENKNDDIQSFDPILIHRALRKHVNFLTGRHLISRNPFIETTYNYPDSVLYNVGSCQRKKWIKGILYTSGVPCDIKYIKDDPEYNPR
jgi:hypothetical protein